MPRRHKITIIGAGNVGATAAHWAASKHLGDVVLVDIADGIPQGKGLDLFQASPIECFDSKVVGSTSYEATAGSDIIIMTGGLARKPGMTRDDLQAKNAEIVFNCIKSSAAVSPNAVIILVTNPLDIMCSVALKASGFPRNRVVGMAGILDTARYRAFLGEALNVSVEDITALVLGGHGDDMVPLVSCTAVGGIPVTQLLAKDKLDAIVERTRKGGGEIVNLLKTGSAFYAPSAAAVQMAESILRDRKRVLPCAAYLEGEYGMSGFFLGVPVILGANGVEKVVEVAMTNEERAALQKSAKSVQDGVSKLTV